MRAQLLAGLRAVLVLTVLTGVAYPLVVTTAAQAAFGDRADGSIVTVDGEAVGSELIGQPFDGDEWFHPRPSAAGDGYDAMASAASNLGPTNEALLDEIRQRVEDYRATNGLDDAVEVPVDAVTASGSGLDPHISVANARLQADRVARSRRMSTDAVLALVDENTSGSSFGVDAVNVLALNLALERAA